MQAQAWPRLISVHLAEKAQEAQVKPTAHATSLRHARPTFWVLRSETITCQSQFHHRRVGCRGLGTRLSRGGQHRGLRALALPPARPLAGTGRPRACRFLGQPLLAKPRPHLHPWGAVMSSQPLRPRPPAPSRSAPRTRSFHGDLEGTRRRSLAPTFSSGRGRREANQETFPRPPPPADQ